MNSNSPARRNPADTPLAIVDDRDGVRTVRFNPTVSDRAILLAPFTEVRQVDRNYTPVVREVYLLAGEDTYAEFNAGGKHAITAKGLQKLADAAGIQFDDALTDWMQGSGISVTARGRRRGPDGVWMSNSSVKTEWFDEMAKRVKREAKDKTPENLEKRVSDERQHLHAKLETKARSRVVRALLAIPAALPKRDIETKPFVLVNYQFTPDWENPHVGQLVAQNMGGAVANLYGRDRPGLRAVPDPHDEPVREIAPPVQVDSALPAGPPKPDGDPSIDGKPVADLVQTEEGLARVAAASVAGQFEADAAPWLGWALGREVKPEDVRGIAESGWSE